MIPSNSTISDVFEAVASRCSDRPFIHHRNEDWTYETIFKKAMAVAHALDINGVNRGDRVALLLGNGSEYVASYFGVLLMGGIVVPLNPVTTTRELSHTLVHCEPAAILYQISCEKSLAPLISQLSNLRILLQVGTSAAPQLFSGPALNFNSLEWDGQYRPTREHVTPEDCAQIIYTSGTTGRPKGVALSHHNLLTNTSSILRYLELTSDDSLLVVLPFFYSYGNSLLLTHMAVGGRLILPSDFVFWNRVLDLMQKEGATGISGVPSTYSILLHRSDFAKRDFPALRYLTCAGGALPPVMVNRVRQVVPDARIFLMYGQTEAAARLSTLMPEDLDSKLGSIGKGIHGVELEVLDDAGKAVPVGEVGEIVARGENIMQGYWKDPQATRSVLHPTGWLHTGDLACVDEEGYIYIVGRKNDLIKSGSYRINPQEIEEVILGHKGVAEVAVVGLADEILGESPVAFVVASSSATALTAEELMAHCRHSLPRYKLIRQVVFVDSLPKTSSGKVKRADLR